MKQGVHILVVDDEPIIRKSISMLLEHDGHQVWQADDGEAALAEMAKRRFDLVITDFSMPGMHGDELVARIRQLLPDQPIIMITAFVAEFKVFGQAAGRVDALLFKPFSFKELREAIEAALTPGQPDQIGGLPPIVEPPHESDWMPPPEP
ncbi:MAG: response regulator [Verrucomicrobiota bacterium]